MGKSEKQVLKIALVITAAVIFLLFVAFTIFMALLSRSQNIRHTSDYLNRYETFLNYSLGDYAVIRDSVVEERTPRGPWSGPGTLSYRAWTLEFTCQDGKERHFRFTNRNPFGYYVTSFAGEMAISHLQSEVVSNYFTTSEPGFTRVHLRMHFQGYPWERKSYRQLLNPRHGLQLASATPQELIANWDFTIHLYATTSSRDSAVYMDAIQRFKAMTRTLAEYLGQDQISIRFRLQHEGITTGDISFRGYYYRQNDTFETRSYREVHGRNT